MASKTIHLGINLIKCVKNIYTKNYETLREFKDDLKSSMKIYVDRLED